MAEEENQNSWPVLSGTAGAEFHLVTNFLWIKSAFVGTYRNCGDVVADRDDDEKVLPIIKAGVLSAYPISAVGQLCHPAQCSNCGVELRELPSTLQKLFLPIHQHTFRWVIPVKQHKISLTKSLATLSNEAIKSTVFELSDISCW